MADGIASSAYVEAVVDSLPDLANWLLGDDSVPVKCGLFGNDIIPDPTELAEQFTPPTYNGYAKQNFPLTGQDPLIVMENGTGNWLVKLGPGLIFKPTNEVNLPQTVFGWFVEKNDSTPPFMIAGRFPSPIELRTSADFIEVEPCVRLMLGGLNGLDQANFLQV